MKVSEIKKELDKFIDYAFGTSGFVDTADVKRHLFEDALDLEATQQIITDLEDEIEARDEQIESLEKRPEIEVNNLREELILEKFAELFAKKDYNTLEVMLDSYELL